EWPARIAVTLAEFGIPRDVAVSRFDRDHAIAAGEIDLVLIKRDAAHRDVSAEVVFPNHLARRAFERLQDTAGVGEVDDPVMDDGCGLVRPALVHWMLPYELQILDVVLRDLVERTVVGCRIVAANHQPVAGVRLAEHRIGDGYEVLYLPRNGDARHGWRTILGA